MFQPIRLPGFVVALAFLACKLAAVVGIVGLTITHATPFADLAVIGLVGILAIVACISRLAMLGFVLAILAFATPVVWLPAACLLIYVAGIVGGIITTSVASAKSARSERTAPSA